MARTTPTKPKTARTRPDEGPVVIKIEHRVLVAEIVEDPHGDQPPLRAAFMAASDFIAEQAEREDPILLEWEYLGGTFRAGYKPDAEATNGNGHLNDVSDAQLLEVARSRGLEVYPA